MKPFTTAALWSAASALAFAASSASAKFLGQKLPIAELAFFRAVFGVVVLAGVWQFVADLGKARDPIGHVLRCGLGVVALYSLMYAFATIPLGLASLLFFSRILLLPVAARIMLGERASAGIWAAVLLGFAGALLSSWPAASLPEWRLGVGAALLAAIASAGSQTAVRRLTFTNSPGLIVLIYTAVSVAATLPMASLTWVTPLVGDWPVLAALGLLALASQFAAACAFQKAPVSFLAPLDFLTIPIAAAFGYALFAEIPSAWTIAGSVLVLGSSAWVTVKSSQTQT
ncbi:drug/metabolite transporter (DMT)-like permease [Azospirillum fermentarium]|uniref:DMT family transporter n=1 Tax=Azospirillum fermentarium TaxID=1233114 RepID=UPI0022279B93|nr:DMT family transporter [Azospirillum fermentarium]MCW2247551.1 drug/metabolite transporter (DMT)-like permease [Azospirillum fermentarium]